MRANRFSSLSLLFFLGKWLLLAFIIAVLAGTASAFFLFSLQWATATREAHRWLIGLLPLPVLPSAGSTCATAPAWRPAIT